MNYEVKQQSEAVSADTEIIVPMNPEDFTDRLDHFVPDKG